PGQQVLAALEQLAAEIRAQPVAEHGDAKRIDDLGQLPDLRLSQELGLVDQHAVQSDRKSTRLNSSHVKISYAVFCLKKTRKQQRKRKGVRMQTDPAENKMCDQGTKQGPRRRRVRHGMHTRA